MCIYIYIYIYICICIYIYIYIHIDLYNKYSSFTIYYSFANNPVTHIYTCEGVHYYFVSSSAHRIYIYIYIYIFGEQCLVASVMVAINSEQE